MTIHFEFFQSVFFRSANTLENIQASHVLPSKSNVVLLAIKPARIFKVQWCSSHNFSQQQQRTHNERVMVIESATTIYVSFEPLSNKNNTKKQPESEFSQVNSIYRNEIFTKFRFIYQFHFEFKKNTKQTQKKLASCFTAIEIDEYSYSALTALQFLI